jgi:hypothetical protein
MDFDPRHQSPVWEEDQILTQQNLRDIIQVLAEQRNQTPLAFLEERSFQSCISTLQMLLNWLEDGKPKKLFIEGEE